MYEKDMKRKVHYSMREGFSLVEVIIAVVILAILVVPMLVYFTNAATSSASGKNSQKANIAAQTAMEEINACTNFSQVEKLGDGGVWTVTTPAPSATDEPVKLERSITVDNHTFFVKAEVDYGQYDGVANRFNDYKEKDLKEIYSESNVIFAETDQRDAAINSFTMDKKGTIDESNITREIHLEIKKMNSAVDSSVTFNVRGFYRYFYHDGANVYKYDTEIGTTEILKSKLEGIYFMYNMVSSSGDDLVVNVSPGIDDGLIKVYFICQTSVVPSGYNLNLVSSDSINQGMLRYVTNRSIPIQNIDALIQTNQIVGDKVSSDRNKRIAKVSVDVYENAGDSKSMIHIDGSKSK